MVDGNGADGKATESGPAGILGEEAALLERLAACTTREDRRDLTLELVVLYSRTGRQAQAMRHVRALLESTADAAEQAQYLLALGQLMEQSGDHVAASAFYREGLALGSGAAGARYLLHNNLAYCVNQTGGHAEAETLCRAAIAMDPERHNAYKNLGVALEGQGRLAEAVDAFVQAVHHNPGDPRALRHLEQLAAAHADAAARVPDLIAKIDACRERVDAARQRMMEYLRRNLSD
jgi:tetratricopeptide (TPR) repeat protein